MQQFITQFGASSHETLENYKDNDTLLTSYMNCCVNCGFVVTKDVFKVTSTIGRVQ